MDKVFLGLMVVFFGVLLWSRYRGCGREGLLVQKHLVHTIPPKVLLPQLFQKQTINMSQFAESIKNADTNLRTQSINAIDQTTNAIAEQLPEDMRKVWLDFFNTRNFKVSNTIQARLTGQFDEKSPVAEAVHEHSRKFATDVGNAKLHELLEKEWACTRDYINELKQYGRSPSYDDQVAKCAAISGGVGELVYQTLFSN
jgi:hypothetical protein